MENREQQILSEIKSMMASIRSQLEMLDAKMAELQRAVDPEDFEAASVDIDIDMDVIPEEETEELVPEVITVQEIPLDEPDDDLPAVSDEQETLQEPEVKPVPTINDVMAPDCAWRKDMPGTPVRDVRSAISLNDRVIFINFLFEEDAQTFVDALTRINAMENLEQVVEFVTSEFPSWDLNSELVYRFMMAVRRKVK